MAVATKRNDIVLYVKTDIEFILCAHWHQMMRLGIWFVGTLSDKSFVRFAYFAFIICVAEGIGGNYRIAPKGFSFCYRPFVNRYGRCCNPFLSTIRSKSIIDTIGTLTDWKRRHLLMLFYYQEITVQVQLF